MKKLTIRTNPISTEPNSSFYELERKYEINIPENLKEFLFEYQGTYVKECVYYNEENIHFTLNGILPISGINMASVEGILEGQKFENIKGFIPFGLDPGGWVFNISIVAET